MMLADDTAELCDALTDAKQARRADGSPARTGTTNGSRCPDGAPVPLANFSLGNPCRPRNVWLYELQTTRHEESAAYVRNLLRQIYRHILILEDAGYVSVVVLAPSLCIISSNVFDLSLSRGTQIGLFGHEPAIELCVAKARSLSRCLRGCWLVSRPCAYLFVSRYTSFRTKPHASVCGAFSQGMSLLRCRASRRVHSSNQ
eukprot:6209279-Pleurochrysis_carterae.AAC.1